jgi:iron-sulfur cluster repair protein YtfE (RIC family)
MNAIRLLDEQHDEVVDLLGQAEEAETPAQMRKLFEVIADQLAIHSAIEERIFYPMVNGEETEEALMEAVEEHLGVKRLIADMLDLTPTDPHFAAKLIVLREQVEHHIEDERRDIFPAVRKMLDGDQLEALGEEMVAMIVDLEGTEPRKQVPAETEHAAELR